jgi:hypothetical protein
MCMLCAGCVQAVCGAIGCRKISRAYFRHRQYPERPPKLADGHTWGVGRLIPTI